MKVLVISESIPDRKRLVGIFAMDQAKALAVLGHEVIFAVVDLRSVRRKRKLGVQHYRRDGLNIFSIAIPIGAVPTAIKDPIGKLALKHLYRLIVSECGVPDIVHAHFLDMGVLAAELCTRENLPLVITEHSSKLNKNVLPANTINRATYVYTSADKVIAVSQALAEKIKLHTGIDAVVIPNVVNMPKVQIELHKNDKANFRFVSAGNLLYGKGFDVLIKAFAEAEKSNHNISLTIMGGGAEELNLKNLVTQLGIEEKVRFWGPYTREQFAEELLNSDVFVLASRGETFGVVYIEALSYGLPVIATRCGGPEDFVNDSNGILVPVDDVQALSDAMLKITQDIDKYDNVAISNAAYAECSPEAVASALSKLFESIQDIGNKQ